MLNINALASVLRGFADVLEAHHDALTAYITPPNALEPGNPPVEAPAPKRRGRPAANSAPTQATSEPEGKSTTVSTDPVETQIAKALAPSTPAIKGMSYQDLQAVIQPLIKQVRGLEVKAVLNKYAPADFKVDENNWYTLQALSEHPEHHAAFVADIEALKM